VIMCAVFECTSAVYTVKQVEDYRGARNLNSLTEFVFTMKMKVEANANVDSERVPENSEVNLLPNELRKFKLPPGEMLKDDDKDEEDDDNDDDIDDDVEDRKATDEELPTRTVQHLSRHTNFIV